MVDSAASGSKPLTPAPAEVVALVRSLGQAITNSNLYSTQHPVTVSAIEQGYERFVPLMEQRGSLTFALVDDQLSLDGELVETNNHLTATFAERMRTLGIPGFTIEKATTPDEFVRLILFLASGATSGGGKGAAALSPENGFDHVKAKTVRYEQILDGQEVVDKRGDEQTRQFSGVVVEQIMAFLKGDVSADGEVALRNIEGAEGNAQALGEMILKAAVVRQQAPGLEQGESLGSLVVGCLRRTFSSLSADPVAGTQKGKKALNRTLVMLEKEVLDKLRAMGGDDAAQAAESVEEACREMQEDLTIDALAEQYAKRVEAVRGNEKRILRYIKRKGVDAAADSGLKDRLMEHGLSADGWHELVVKSGVDTKAVGAAVGADRVNEGSETGRLLAMLLTRLSEVVSVSPSAPGETADQVVGKLADEVKKTTERAESKIRNLTDGVRRLAASPGKGGETGKDPVEVWITAAVAEICQELRQPLAVVNCTIDIVVGGKLGPLDPVQRETLRMAMDCCQRLALLVSKLETISGMPSSLTPDQELIQSLYK
jgi:hypothetical protein